jgi:hypothetical protein
MKNMIAVLAAGTMMTLTAAPVFAQDAMADAVGRQICGAETRPLEARYLDNGSLYVLCPCGSDIDEQYLSAAERDSLTCGPFAAGGATGGASGAAGAAGGAAGAAGAQGALLAGGLSAGAAAGIFTAVVVAIAAGGDGETTTTTTTTTTTN